MKFKGTTPCKDCPYRLDAPLQKWDISHFSDLLRNDADYMGSLYDCHKNNGSVCRGWLMDQDKRRFPSIRLRLELSRQQITREYLDALHCKAPLFDSVKQICISNYPQLNQQEDKP